ncbi:6-O-methylguanine DNA methyltransferase [Apiosordaria backusii]|uniref:6-O-methylguanine DNA methyltransferase n=1 Tax=Apiosordaria backusii TaxID=314023 RepID=A0AA40EGW6_9PEZI|nr:6-O-methylguanine DNA methyltransferase [Apiosordaria backusii]
MPRTPEAQAFFHAVYAAVQEIPEGKVTTYGHIAKLIGTPQRPRQVGTALKHLPSDTSLRYHHDNVPWQRPGTSSAILTESRSQPEGARNQAANLQAEGVAVTTGALGELMVDFAEFGWFPRLLPSEEAAGVIPDDSDDDDGESE